MLPLQRVNDIKNLLKDDADCQRLILNSYQQHRRLFRDALQINAQKFMHSANHLSLFALMLLSLGQLISCQLQYSSKSELLKDIGQNFNAETDSLFFAKQRLEMGYLKEQFFLMAYASLYLIAFLIAMGLVLTRFKTIYHSFGSVMAHLGIFWSMLKTRHKPNFYEDVFNEISQKINEDREPPHRCMISLEVVTFPCHIERCVIKNGKPTREKLAGIYERTVLNKWLALTQTIPSTNEPYCPFTFKIVDNERAAEENHAFIRTMVLVYLKDPYGISSTDCSSPLSNISVTMSQPPTNFPCT